MWWDEKAARLQDRVRSDESERHQGYTEEQVNQATVHARQDMILLISLLSTANGMLASIRFTLLVLTVAVIAIGLKAVHVW